MLSFAREERGAIKRWYLTLLSGQNPQADHRWRHGGREIWTLILHSDLVTRSRVLGELDQQCPLHLTQQSTLDTLARPAGEGRINTGSCCINCVVKATLRLELMIDCEKSKTRHRNQQPVGENNAIDNQSRLVSEAATEFWRWGNVLPSLVNWDLSSGRWSRLTWKDGGIFKPTHSQQISPNPVRCLRWLVFKNMAVGAVILNFYLDKIDKLLNSPQLGYALTFTHDVSIMLFNFQILAWTRNDPSNGWYVTEEAGKKFLISNKKVNLDPVSQVT